jgi:hypothetical protein
MTEIPRVTRLAWFGLLSVALMLCGCDDQKDAKRFEFREDKAGHLIRVDPSSGEAIIADSDGPRQLLAPKDISTQKLLASDALTKVTGNARCDMDTQTFSGRIYNGTGVVLRTVGVSITDRKYFPENEVYWTRDFVIRDLYIRPFEVGTFAAPMTGLESPKCDWNIKYAYTVPWNPDATSWQKFQDLIR